MTNWPTKKLGEVAYFQEGPGLRSFQFKSTGIKVINVANVQNGYLDLEKTKFIDPSEVEKKYKHFLVEENDILISTSGTIGRVAKTKKENLPLMLNTSVVRFRTLDKNILLNDFLLYFLRSSLFLNKLLKFKTGVAIFNVGPSHLKKIRIQLPPLQIQKQIVERLDKIVEAQKLNNDLIQKSDELFQSLLHKELDPAGKNWEMKKLSEVGEIITGTTPSTKNSDYWNGEFLWATPTDIKENTFMLVDTPRKLSREGYKKTRPVPKNAILVTCIASIGKMALAGKEMATNQQINSIVCNKGSDPFFVFFSLQKGKKKLINLGKTTAVPIINKSEFGRIKIPLPPIQTQKQIVVKLSAAQDYKTQLLTQKLKLKELFNSVLSKSFRG